MSDSAVGARVEPPAARLIVLSEAAGARESFHADILARDWIRRLAKVLPRFGDQLGLAEPVAGGDRDDRTVGARGRDAGEMVRDSGRPAGLHGSGGELGGNAEHAVWVCQQPDDRVAGGQAGGGRRMAASDIPPTMIGGTAAPGLSTISSRSGNSRTG